jgi:hypothetical protein
MLATLEWNLRALSLRLRALVVLYCTLVVLTLRYSTAPRGTNLADFITRAALLGSHVLAFHKAATNAQLIK